VIGGSSAVLVVDPDEVVDGAPSTDVVVWPGTVEPTVDEDADPSSVHAATTSTIAMRSGISRRTMRSQIIGGPELDLTN
jgi:hypothetical protein